MSRSPRPDELVSFYVKKAGPRRAASSATSYPLQTGRGRFSSRSCQSRGRTGQPAGAEVPSRSELGGTEQLLRPRPHSVSGPQRPREGRTPTCDHTGS